MTADDGLVQVEQSGNKIHSPKFIPKGGMLDHHVIITFGPKETFVPDSTNLQPGQIQVRLSKAIEFDYSACGFSPAMGMSMSRAIKYPSKAAI